MYQSVIAQPAPSSQVRIGEVLSAFSYALDLTEGQPSGHSIRAAWIGTLMGLAAGLRGSALSDCTYAVLLKDLGCSSNAARVAELFLGDDRKLKHQFKLIGPEAADFLAFIQTRVGEGESEAARRCAIDTLTCDAGPLLSGFIDTRCNQGARIARALRFSDRVAEAIACLDEHWDGGGMPIGLIGDDIPLISRIALLAQVADVFFMTGGAEVAMAEIAARRGSWFDPHLADLFAELGSDPGFWAELGAPDIEARLHGFAAFDTDVTVDEDYLDAIAAAFGQVIDAKSPFTSGHSERVGFYSDAIAAELGMDAGERRRLRRAAMLHDIGKLGVSSRILEKPGKLDESEWREMRDHAAMTAEILSRIGVMRDMAMIAAAHHEKLDGTGYPLGLDAALIGMETRIITAADIYDALTADRPYRGAMPAGRALAIMETECGVAVDPACLRALTTVVARGGVAIGASGTA
jgi:putative nucleotidyltransferase with HDIG domain